MTLSEYEVKMLNFHYKKKKEKIAKQIKYTKYSYSIGPDGTKLLEKSGEEEGKRYGYTLKDPYTSEEVEEFEKNQSIKLDSDLKDYLIKVSREIYVYAYPEIVYLSKNDIGTCQIPEDKTFYNQVIENHKSDCIEDCDNDECYIDSTDGMLYIGEGGCSFSHQMVVKGNHLGSVWYCDGDDVSLKTKTFREYIFKEFKK